MWKVAGQGYLNAINDENSQDTTFFDSAEEAIRNITSFMA